MTPNSEAAALPVDLGTRPRTLIAHRPLGISRSASGVPPLHPRGSLPHHLSASQCPQEGGITLSFLLLSALSLSQGLVSLLASLLLPGTGLTDIALLNSSSCLRNGLLPLPGLLPALWLSAAQKQTVNFQHCPDGLRPQSGRAARAPQDSPLNYLSRPLLTALRWGSRAVWWVF